LLRACGSYGEKAEGAEHAEDLRVAQAMHKGSVAQARRAVGTLRLRAFLPKLVQLSRGSG
jgi:hypothetical protein